MMKYILYITRSVSFLGLREEDDPLLKFRVTLCNEAMSLLILMDLISVLKNISFGFENPSSYKSLWVLPIPLLVLFLNRNRWFTGSFLTTTLVSPTILLIYHLTYGETLGVTHLLLCVIVSITLFYDRTSWIIANILIVSMYIIGARIYFDFHHYDLEKVTLLDSTITNVASIFIIGWAVYKAFNQIKLHYTVIAEHNKTLIHQNRALEESLAQNHHRNEMLSLLAHDLHAPVLAFHQLAEKINYLIKKNEIAKLQSLASYFESRGKTLFDDLENLLTWVSTQKDRLILHQQIINLKYLVDPILARMQAIYSNKNIRIESNIHPNQYIYTDPDILKLVLRNLIQNSYKYSRNNAIITLHLIQDVHGNVLTIQDHAGGISQSTLELIQFNSPLPKDQIKGHGIGLQLSIRLLHEMNNSIKIINFEDGLKIRILLQ